MHKYANSIKLIITIISFNYGSLCLMYIFKYLNIILLFL